MKYLKAFARGLLYGLIVMFAWIADGSEWLSVKCIVCRDRLE